MGLAKLFTGNRKPKTAAPDRKFQTVLDLPTDEEKEADARDGEAHYLEKRIKQTRATIITLRARLTHDEAALRRIRERPR